MQLFCSLRPFSGRFQRLLQCRGVLLILVIEENYHFRSEFYIEHLYFVKGPSPFNCHVALPYTVYTCLKVNLYFIDKKTYICLQCLMFHNILQSNTFYFGKCKIDNFN